MRWYSFLYSKKLLILLPESLIFSNFADVENLEGQAKCAWGKD